MNAVYKLCSEHFELSQFFEPKHEKRAVRRDAIPTIFNVPNPPKRLESSRRVLIREFSRSPSTSNAAPRKQSKIDPGSEELISPAQPTQVSPTKQRLRTKVKRLQTEVWRLRKNKLKSESAQNRAQMLTLISLLQLFLPETTAIYQVSN